MERIVEVNDPPPGMSAADVMAVRVATDAVVSLLRPMGASVQVSTLASITLNCLSDYGDPTAVWERLKAQIDQHLPAVIRNSCAGEG